MLESDSRIIKMKLANDSGQATNLDEHKNLQNPPACISLCAELPLFSMSKLFSARNETLQASDGIAPYRRFLLVLVARLRPNYAFQTVNYSFKLKSRIKYDIKGACHKPGAGHPHAVNQCPMACPFVSYALSSHLSNHTFSTNKTLMEGLEFSLGLGAATVIRTTRNRSIGPQFAPPVECLTDADKKSEQRFDFSLDNSILGAPWKEPKKDKETKAQETWKTPLVHKTPCFTPKF
ncbi:hypothetical protein O181_023954 [Austropuccinia psidii MF-1]|uniref:Uncharacterized protein n=1 Tax=Austropuccinia psidii MF-1 TaxID=1389203 RepID=A0A9Q3GZ68_9BASI|nr:hypothetical protein [Austropuccinia psidii MF-1]